MKLLRADREGFHFDLSPREKRLLFDLLKFYPRVPAAHQRLSRTAQPQPNDENQRLLDDAVTAHREENKRQILAWLNEPERFKPTGAGHRFTLSAPQMEWLLQVLNDVRVGSWIALGSPDTEAGEKITLDERTAPHFWVMEMAGFFESALLEALEGE